MTCGPHLISIFIKIDLIDNLIKKKNDYNTALGKHTYFCCFVYKPCLFQLFIYLT